VNIQHCSDLAECERALSARLADKTLLGELPLSADDVRSLGSLFRRRGGVDELWNRFPCSAACFTTAVFAHYYTGNYWTHFAEHYLELSSRDENVWRTQFETFLIRMGMANLGHVDGQRFLRHVRVHALIPRGAVGRLLEHVVRPAVLHGLDDGEWTAAEILDELGIDHRLHRPEADFLRYGGHVADDVLGRCITLYRRATDGADVDDRLDLPEWLLDGFDEWLAAQARHASTALPTVHSPQPYLRLAIDSGSIVLVLPSLPESWRTRRTMSVVAEQSAAPGVELVIRGIEVDPYVRRVEGRQEVQLRVAAPRYRVEWRKEGETQPVAQRVRGFVGSGSPWALFGADDQDNRLIREQFAPRGLVWLVSREDAAIMGVPQGEMMQAGAVGVLEEFRLETMPDMVARLVDTSGLVALVLDPAIGSAREHIAVDLAPRIELVEAIHGVSVGGAPVCAGVPRVNCAGSDTAVTVEIEQLQGAASPALPHSVEARRLSEVLQGRAGVFNLRVRGRLGRRLAPASVAIIPGLQVQFDPQLVTPDHEGLIALAVCAPGLETRGDGPYPGFDTTDGGAMVLTPDARRVQLLATHTGPGGQRSELVLSVTVPRLLIGFSVPDGDEPDLLPAVARIPKHTVRAHPRLFLDLVLQPDPGRWQVTLRADALRATCTRPPQRPTPSASIRFDLSMWRDAIVHSPERHQLRADIAIADGVLLSGIVVAEIASTCRLLSVQGAFGMGGGSDTLSYKFDAGGPVAPLRLINTCYPWLEPRVIEVPADHSGRVAVRGLPPGEYAVEPAAEGSCEPDIIPDLADMKRLLLLTRNAEPCDGWEGALRTIAQTWDDVWIHDGTRWLLDHHQAERAGRDMARHVDALLSAHARLPVRADDVTHTATLMVFWGRKAARCPQPRSPQYWARAVWLTTKLLDGCGRVPRPVQTLAERIDNLRAHASPETRETIRHLQGILRRYEQSQ